MTGAGSSGAVTNGRGTSAGAADGMIAAAGDTGGAGTDVNTGIGRGVTPTDAALPCTRCTRLRK